MAQKANPDGKIHVVQIVGRMMGGGVEATTMNHYRFIDRDAITFDFFAQENSQHIPYDEIHALGGQVHLIPTYNNLFTYMDKVEQLLRELQPDIVHSNMNALSVFSLRAAKKAGVPIRIAHSHSTANPKEGKKTIIKNMLRPLSRIYPTEYAACGIRSGTWLFGKKLMEEGDVKMIYNAVDLTKYSPSMDIRTRMRRELGIDDKLVIGQVGRLCFQKNQRFTLEVFRDILGIQPNAELFFAGTGPTEVQLKQRAFDMGISNKVHFLGLRSDVNDLNQAFDVLLSPSQYEGLPVSLVESQAIGCPALVSIEVTTEVQIVPDMIHFMSLNDSTELWAKRVLSIAGNRSMDKMVNDHYLSEAGYDIRQSSKDLGDWYKELVTNQKK